MVVSMLIYLINWNLKQYYTLHVLNNKIFYDIIEKYTLCVQSLKNVGLEIPVYIPIEYN